MALTPRAQWSHGDDTTSAELLGKCHGWILITMWNKAAYESKPPRKRWNLQSSQCKQRRAYVVTSTSHAHVLSKGQVTTLTRVYMAWSVACTYELIFTCALCCRPLKCQALTTQSTQVNVELNTTSELRHKTSPQAQCNAHQSCYPVESKHSCAKMGHMTLQGVM